MAAVAASLTSRSIGVRIGKTWSDADLVAARLDCSRRDEDGGSEEDTSGLTSGLRER